MKYVEMFRKMIAVGTENQTKEVTALLMHHAGSLSAVSNITFLNGVKLRHNFGTSARDRFSNRVTGVQMSLNASPFRK
jgi:hypothetical protein